MFEEDEEYTNFITYQSLFCYRVIVVQILLYSQTRKSIVVYINSDECRFHEQVDLIMCKVNFRSLF